jgi:hypothetical protein
MTRVADHDFGVDEFLARPLTARVATNGPTVRPAWYLWEDGAFWLLTGPWARLLSRVQPDPAVAIVVDECDLVTGTVPQVIARGQAELVLPTCPRLPQAGPLPGPGRGSWDERFRRYLHDIRAGTAWLASLPADCQGPELPVLTGAVRQRHKTAVSLGGRQPLRAELVRVARQQRTDQALRGDLVDRPFTVGVPNFAWNGVLDGHRPGVRQPARPRRG